MPSCTAVATEDNGKPPEKGTSRKEKVKKLLEKKIQLREKNIANKTKQPGVL